MTGAPKWLLALAALVTPAAPVPAEPAFGPRYVLEGIEVRGLRKTEPWVVWRELGLRVGEEVAPTDPRVESARLRLLALGLFLDVKFSLAKGVRRGGAVLVVTVEERGTIIINAIHLGTSEATALWGGLDVAETNFLGRGLGVGGGFVASSRPRVPGAEPARAFSLRAAAPIWTEGTLAPYGSL